MAVVTDVSPKINCILQGQKQKVINKNLLINWDFRNPVKVLPNLTYYSTSNSRTATIHNWNIASAADETNTLTIDPDNQVVTFTTTTGINNMEITTPCFYQDGMKLLPNQEYTCSVLISNIIGTCRIMLATYEDNQFNFTINEPLTTGLNVFTFKTDSKKYFAIYLNAKTANASFSIKAAKLELGNKQTLAEKDNNGEWYIIDTNLIYVSSGQLITDKIYTNTSVNPNLLDNWYFADPINQRGQTEYTGYTYSIDRWKCEGEMTVSLAADGILLQTGATTSIFKQLIDIQLPINTQIIFSILVKDVKPPVFISYGTWNIAVEPDKVTSMSLTIDQLGQIGPYIWGREYGSCKVIAAKLELGTQQTLAHQDASGNWVLNDPPPNKALELLKCQRYQLVLDNESVLFGRTEYDSSLSLVIPTPVTMRANPVISIALPSFVLNGTVIQPRGTYTVNGNLHGNEITTWVPQSELGLSEELGTIPLLELFSLSVVSLVVDANL